MGENIISWRSLAVLRAMHEYVEDCIKNSWLYPPPCPKLKLLELAARHDASLKHRTSLTRIEVTLIKNDFAVRTGTGSHSHVHLTKLGYALATGLLEHYGKDHSGWPDFITTQPLAPSALVVIPATGNTFIIYESSGVLG